jgi:subtilase family serine protease
VARARLIGLAIVAMAFCGGSLSAASAAPMHVMYTGTYPTPPAASQCETDYEIACYTPLQIEQAYAMPQLYSAGLNGAGKTIVIVDPFGSPSIVADLQTFDQAFGLAAPPSVSVLQPEGPVDAVDHPGWGEETSMDVEYAHAMAPGASILVVETPADETEGTAGFPQIVQAENDVIDKHLGDVISQSFGATEQTFPRAASLLALRSAFVSAFFHNITVIAATGDSGPTELQAGGSDFYTTPAVAWPASDPLVTAVGGTQLHLDANGDRTAPDNVWNDSAQLGVPAASAGGLSTVFTTPFYQWSVASIVGRARGIPDISMSAAINGGVDVYSSIASATAGIAAGWHVIGGTSLAAPLFAGVVAIADQSAHRDLGLVNARLYTLGYGTASGLVAVTAGDNAVTVTGPAGTPVTMQGTTATDGYDLATGLGTVSGPALVATLASGGPAATPAGSRHKHGHPTR